MAYSFWMSFVGNVRASGQMAGWGFSAFLVGGAAQHLAVNGDQIRRRAGHFSRLSRGNSTQ